MGFDVATLLHNWTLSFRRTENISMATGKEKISPSRIPVIELQIIRKLQSLPRYSGTCKSLEIVILNEIYGNKC